MNRKEKMLVPLTICHLVLTALAIVLSVIGLATILRIADAPYEYSVTILILITYAIHIIALACCAVYVFKGYSKVGALLFKSRRL